MVSSFLRRAQRNTSNRTYSATSSLCNGFSIELSSSRRHLKANFCPEIRIPRLHQFEVRTLTKALCLGRARNYLRPRGHCWLCAPMVVSRSQASRDGSSKQSHAASVQSPSLLMAASSFLQNPSTRTQGTFSVHYARNRSTCGGTDQAHRQPLSRDRYQRTLPGL